MNISPQTPKKACLPNRNNLICFGIACLTIIHPLCLSAQSSSRDRLDSLILVADTIRDDSLKINAMYAVANTYFLSYLDSSMRWHAYLREGIRLSQQQNDPLNELRGWNDMGTFTREEGLLDSASQCYLRAISLAETNDWQEAYHQMTDNLSVVYGYQGRFDEALALKQNSLDYFLSTNDSLSITITLANIGLLYFDRSNFAEGLSHTLRSMRYAYPSDTLIMGVLWENAGTAYKNLDRFDSATIAYNHASRLLEGQDARGHFRVSFNQGLMLIQQDSFERALSIFEKIDGYSDRFDFADYYYYQLEMAYCYLEIGKYDEARNAFEFARDKIAQSEEPNHRLRYREVAYEFARQQGDYQEALKQYQGLHNIRDSLYSLEKETAFADIEEKYQAEQKERVIQEQQLELFQSQNRQRLLFLSMVSILLVSGISILFINRTRRTEKALQEAEINSLKQENKLISLQSMLQGQEEERKRIARDLHDNIGAMMTTLKIKVLSIQRQIEDLEQLNIARELDTMIGNAASEIRRISHQMTPVALELAGLTGAVSDLLSNVRGQGLAVTSDLMALDLVKDQEMQIILFRVLQELSNNILKHSQASEVQLKTWMQNQRLIIDLQDNGIGLNIATWRQGSKSLGLRSIQSRIDYLDGEMTLQEGNGTRFRIIIPL